MPPLRYIGTPAQYDIRTGHDNDLVDLDYINFLLAQNLDVGTVTGLINTALAPYATQSYANTAMASLATAAYVQTQNANYVPLSSINHANGPIGLDVLGQVSPGLINASSTQQWPSPFWSPNSYGTSASASTTPTQLFTITIPDPGYPYVVSCFGLVDTQVATDNGIFAEVLVRQGSTGGEIVAFGYGVGERYTGPTPGGIASKATRNTATVVRNNGVFAAIPGWVGVNDGTFNTTMVGDYIKVASSLTGASLAGSVAYTGASSSIQSIRIVDGTGAVIATGSGISAPSGTCTVNFTGNFTAGQLLTLQGRGTGANAGSWQIGSLTLIASQITNSSTVNMIPTPFADQTPQTAGSTYYVMLASSDNTTVVSTSTFDPSLWVMPIPWVPNSNIVTAKPVGVPGSWTLEFEDDFDGTSLDASVWEPFWYSDGLTLNNVPVHASNVSVSGGNLILKLATITSGACVSSRPASPRAGFTLGTECVWEARILFPGDGSNIYNWPAFWVLNDAAGDSSVEIDIAEIWEGALQTNYHGGSSNPSHTYPGYYGGNYHIWTLHRTATSMDFYIDGILSYTLPTPVSDNGHPQYVLFNVGKTSSGAHNVLGAASQVLVDYVRAWSPT